MQMLKRHSVSKHMYSKQKNLNHILLNRVSHGQLTRWYKWRACDVGEAKQGFENEMWLMWNNGRVGKWAVTYILQPFRHFAYVILQPFRCFTYVTAHSPMSSVHSPTFQSLRLRHNSFSNPSVALPTSQLILQPFRCFTYVTVHSPTLLSLPLRHTLFT